MFKKSASWLFFCGQSSNFRIFNFFSRQKHFCEIRFNFRAPGHATVISIWTKNTKKFFEKNLPSCYVPHFYEAFWQNFRVGHPGSRVSPLDWTCWGFFITVNKLAASDLEILKLAEDHLFPLLASKMPPRNRVLKIVKIFVSEND